MSNAQKTSNDWTSFQAYALSVVCLAIGLAGGWFIRGSQSSTSLPVENASAAGPEGMGQPTPEQLRRMADKQAAVLLDELQKDQTNPDLLARIGNVYYDAQ
jgi:hypothetical protein